MKTRNLLVALGCAAALTACTNNDEPAVAPAMRTVTLSVEVEEPAGTRVAYSEEGNTYKFAWSEGDKLRVFYNDGEEKYADFEIVASSIDGNKADFTCTNTEFANFTGNVTIGYCDNNYFKGTDGNVATCAGDAITESFPLTVQLAAQTVLFADNVAVSNGTLPSVKLKHAYAYLLLKNGLQVTDDTATVGSSDNELMLNINIGKGSNSLSLKYTSEGMNPKINSSITQIRSVYVTNGKLTRDYLVPIYVEKEGGTLELETFTYSNNSKGNVVTQKSRSYTPGVIYEVAASGSGWVSAPMPAAE